MIPGLEDSFLFPGVFLTVFLAKLIAEFHLYNTDTVAISQ